jgi:quercetin dioxygenase-like cupin family protein
MKRLIATAPSLALVGAASASAQRTEKSPNGSQPSSRGAAEYFTGSVIVEPLFGAKETMPSTGGLVTFEPGARSAWHTHPAGQVLITTSGTGWCRRKAARSTRSSRAM